MQGLEGILEEIDETIERYGKNPYIDGKVTDICYGLNIAKNIICKHMNDGWIPVEDGMPEPYQQVLVSMYNNLTYVTIGSYDGGRWNVNEYITDLGVDVKAWRPLPQPYRSERSEGE